MGEANPSLGGSPTPQTLKGKESPGQRPVCQRLRSPAARVPRRPTPRASAGASYAGTGIRWPRDLGFACVTMPQLCALRARLAVVPALRRRASARQRSGGALRGRCRPARPVRQRFHPAWLASGACDERRRLAPPLRRRVAAAVKASCPRGATSVRPAASASGSRRSRSRPTPSAHFGACGVAAVPRMAQTDPAARRPGHGCVRPPPGRSSARCGQRACRRSLDHSLSGGGLRGIKLCGAMEPWARSGSASGRAASAARP